MKYIKHLGFSTIKRVLHETENTQTILLLQSFTITLSHPSYTKRAARMGLCSHTWILTHQSTHTLYCYAFFNEGKIIRLIRRKTKKKENKRKQKGKEKEVVVTEGQAQQELEISLEVLSNNISSSFSSAILIILEFQGNIKPFSAILAKA